MKKGFTLIELLVVITILAVLAGAALPYVQNYVEESRVAKTKTDLEEIARALAVYETREGDYQKETVADLTGRYLNKSPIDPWGSQYIVDPKSGTVYSTGPDRSDSDTGGGKFDNIVVPYQPPMALVSAKWVDKNQSGAVDFQNVSDELHLAFSRKFNDGVTGTTLDEISGVIFKDKSMVLASIIGGSPTIVASKILVYKINVNSAFVPGQSYLTVTDSQQKIFDQADPVNYCLSSQDVKILPQ